MSEPLACTEVQDRIEAFLDHELGEPEARELEKHVAVCTSCEEELAWAGQVNVGLRTLRPETCPDSVVRALTEELAQESQSRRRFAPWVGLAIAAGLLALLVIAPLALRLDRSLDRTVETAYSQEQLAQAEREARLAFAYLGAVTQKARVTLRNDVLLPRVVDPPRRALRDLRR